MEKIKFEDINFGLNNYVKDNMEVFEKSFKLLPEFERPIYCFHGEDNNQRIAHIQYDNKWIIEPEVDWQEKSIRGQDEDDDNTLLPNSMYSLIRSFDNKKLKYFNDVYKKSHLYLYERKIRSDTFDPSLQIKFIKRIIELATVNPETFGLPPDCSH
jgi:hypothetical protein